MPIRLTALRSLRVRIVLAMLLLASIGSAIFAAGIYSGAERLEQTVLNRHVIAEFERLAQASREDMAVRAVRSALLLGFVGADNPELPPELAALEDGSFHAVAIGPKLYQAYVGEDLGRRIFVAYDITEWEALERPVINTLIGGVVLSSVLAIVLGFWLSAQVIAPVTSLSKRVQALDPEERHVRLADEFAGAEIESIARAFDRYMERLDGFVEREQLFASAAAHELRTPLAVIQGATDVLAEQHGLPPAAERATGRLRRAARDMREFIEALLFLSREKRRHEFDQSTSDISQIVRQLAGDYRQLTEGSPIEIVVDADEPLPLDVPPALPAIVISNLIRNAVENTERGRIDISLGAGVLRIADTGRGIPRDVQELLFDRDFSTKPAGGMGLHLTKRICDRFGWKLTVASTQGKGTTVSVNFSNFAEPI